LEHQDWDEAEEKAADFEDEDDGLSDPSVSENGTTNIL